ncbi:MAG: hypothetical protein ACRDQZ_05335 [Mycobacteriales bacterium]
MVNVGNPHLVCVVDPVKTTLADLKLDVAPGHDPRVFPRGVNIEFVTYTGTERLRMRVHERGVGESRSCGTGTVAVLAAALHLAGRVNGESIVELPGGQVRVAIGEQTSTLTGPAVLIAHGELDASWWDGL